MISAVQVDPVTTSCRDQQEREHLDDHSLVAYEISQPRAFVDLSANRLSSIDSPAESISNEYDVKALEFVTAEIIKSRILQIL